MTNPVHVDLSSSDALRRARTEQLTGGGLLVAGCHEAGVFKPLGLLVELPGGERHQVAGKVINKTPDGQAFVFLDDGPAVAALVSAIQAADGVVRKPPEPERAPPPPSPPPPPPPPRPAQARPVAKASPAPTPAGDAYLVDLADPAVLRRARAEQLSANGLAVAGGTRVPLFGAVTLDVRLPAGDRHEVTGKIVNKAPAGAGFFVVLDATHQVQGLRDAVDAAVSQAVAAAVAPEPEVAPSAVEAPVAVEAAEVAVAPSAAVERVAEGRYEVDLSDRAALREVREQQLTPNGILVPAAPAEALYGRVELVLMLPGFVELEVAGRIVHRATDSFFALLDEGARLDALRSAADVELAAPEEGEEAFDWSEGFDEPTRPAAPEPEPEPVPEPEPKPELRPAPPRQLINPASGVPIAQQIAALGAVDRATLAGGGSAVVRRILAHDTDKRVLLALVQNPETIADEVLGLTENPKLPSTVIRAMISDERFIRRRDIALRLACNPGTARAMAFKLVDHLRPDELQVMLRVPFTPASVKAYASKRLEGG